MNGDALSRLATGRKHDLFIEDVECCRKQIADAVNGKRVLIIGGAGSIGSSTVLQIAHFIPRSLHVVDQNENNLAELVRDIRSQKEGFPVSDFRALPIDFGSPVMRRLVKEQPSYDFVLNFAALKHVRSEKDTLSLLQMLDTNIIKQARLLEWLAEKSSPLRYFCVSTDKAANPVNMMGASKRLMEHVIFSSEACEGAGAVITSARFANVAFSDGSLLYSWLRRMEKRQPVVVPRKTKRFFISLREAGQLCVIAGTCAPDRTIVIPRFHPEKDLRELFDIATAFLRFQGFDPHECHSEEEAKASIDADLACGRYPLLLTPLDTSGEKPYEEFIGKGERGEEIGLPNLLAIYFRGFKDGRVKAFLSSIEQFLEHANVEMSKDHIIQLIKSVVPEFQHNETGKSLDNQM